MRKVLAVLVFSFLQQNLEAAYTIKYFDCSAPTQISTYQHAEICNYSSDNPATPTSYTLLQTRLIEKLTGYSCTITRSTWTHYCGAYSHLKLAQPPEIEIPEPGSTVQCQQLIRQGLFTTLDGKTHTVSLNSENIIHSFDLGTIFTSGGGIACQGETYKIGEQIIQNIVKVSQIKIVLQQEEFIVAGTQVEAMTDRIRLPEECHPYTGGCQLAAKTFIWSQPIERCELERVRTMNMVQEGDYLVDTSNKVLLKKLDPIPTPNHCGQSVILATEYPNLFITTTAEPWEDMTSDVDISEFIAGRDDYILWTTEKRTETQTKNLLQHMCQQDMRHPASGSLVHIKEQHFLKRNGDVVEHIQCSPRTGRIREDAPLCYDQIPIDTPDGKGFIQPSTRTFLNRATPRPCYSHFGLKIFTNEGIWIELNPYPKAIPEPKRLPLVQGITQGQHEDISTGGLYSDSELQSWRKHMEIGDFHESVSKTISYGVCVHEGECQPNSAVPAFNLQHLEKPIESFPFAWWTKLEKTLQAYTSLLCIIVILIEGFKAAIIIGLFTQVAIAQGPDALKALAYLICCTAHRDSRKVRRRHRRASINKEEELNIGDDKTPMFKLEPDL